MHSMREKRYGIQGFLHGFRRLSALMLFNTVYQLNLRCSSSPCFGPSLLLPLLLLLYYLKLLKNYYDKYYDECARNVAQMNRGGTPVVATKALAVAGIIFLDSLGLGFLDVIGCWDFLGLWVRDRNFRV